MKVVFSRRAERDLMSQVDWLSQRSPKAARQAADQIEAAIRLLGDFPMIAPLVDDRRRECAVSFGRDGFVLRDRIEGQQAVVVRLYHGRQSRPSTASRS